MKVLGEGKLSFAAWDIYHATLYSPDTIFNANKPFALKLTYLRSFKKKHLIKETEKQMRKLSCLDGKQSYKPWAEQLNRIWPDVEKQDSLTLFVSDQGESWFYFNHHLLGKISDIKFSQCFSGIWLSDKTSRPKLRKKLLGNI
ncbi:chalcone isomerase family protein [Agarilytica rhodophyticola]|uniref:chalcone isomerase family protein n=1 Tax=Agarilytica rhodophyticola TaxID=1737490 RepID=UPI00131A3E25|nr:chalcone isomerase family protein [Agarilytica rhodophyticola]